MTSFELWVTGSFISELPESFLPLHTASFLEIGALKHRIINFDESIFFPFGTISERPPLPHRVPHILLSVLPCGINLASGFRQVVDPF